MDGDHRENMGLKTSLQVPSKTYVLTLDLAKDVGWSQFLLALLLFKGASVILNVWRGQLR